MNKYGARKTQVDGFTFDSKRESERYAELKLLEKAGAIVGFMAHQPSRLRYKDLNNE